MTLRVLVQSGAAAYSNGVAIAAPRCAPMSYRRLGEMLARTASAFAALGIRRTSRVVVVLPAGPRAVTAVLAAMDAAVCVPLNPAYRQPEFDTRLRRLKADVLLTDRPDSAAGSAARACGVPLMLIAPERGAVAGEFELAGGAPLGPPGPALDPRPEDLAVVMQTSGTTGEPKTVPLTHANLCAAASHIRAAMWLGPDDRFLNVAAIHHIAGIGLTLASLAAGSAICCPPGFRAAELFDWAGEFRPTWIWLAPAMLRSLLPHARRNAAVLERCPLRFIRSGSAALPPALLEEAEALFRVPLIENYGMTEAAPQITSNPLPPGRRKPGSAGIPAGPEVMIWSERGGPAAPGEVGEILIRGPNVMQGYEDDNEANGRAFRDGWFRTGDLGLLDEEGYLFVQGRARDIINRGGEKISPREIEDVLMRHPAVAEAAAFAVPHDGYVEDAAAAVVLRDGAVTSEARLREFLGASLADFKVPTRILIVAEIPKGPGGKLERSGLAARLGCDAGGGGSPPAAGFAAPATLMEKALAEIWPRILGVRSVGIHDDFFQLGGDSFAVNLLLTEVQERFGAGNRLLERIDFFDCPTIATQARILAAVLERRPVQGAEPAPSPNRAAGALPVIFLQSNGSKPPFFFVPWMDENPYYVLALSRCLGDDRPFCVLRDPTPAAERGVYSVTGMALRFLEAVRLLQPRGPYILSGHCAGGPIAFEMARRLRIEREEVALLILFDTPTPRYPHPVRHWRVFLEGVRCHLARARNQDSVMSWFTLAAGALGRQVRRLAVGTLERKSLERGRASSMPPPRNLAESNLRANRMYVPGRYDGRIVHFITQAHVQTGHPLDRRLGWRELAQGGVDLRTVPGNHLTMFAEPHVRAVAAQVRPLLDEAEAR